jgi:uncharacterized RDD family membrane protein YckC
MTDDVQVGLKAAPAGWWRRFGSLLIDGIVLSVVSGILRLIIGMAAGEGLGILISLGYFTYFHGRTGQTPGDAVLGVRVVDVRERIGEPIGYGRAALRWLVSIVSFVVFFIGYLWMLWDSNKQTWHDKAAGSVPIHPG